MIARAATRWLIEGPLPDIDPLDYRKVERVAAVHEAGHIVAALALGMRVRRAMIDEDGGGWTHVDQTGAPRTVRAQQWLAGMAAQQIYGMGPEGCGIDYREAALLVETQQDLVIALDQASDVLYCNGKSLLFYAETLLDQRIIKFPATQWSAQHP